MSTNISAERSLAGMVLISVLIAAVASQSGMLKFGSFGTMALVLIGANVVTYALTKLGLFKSPRD